MADLETPRQHPQITLAVLALGGITFALLQSLVAPALPEIQHAMNTTEAGASWVLTAYLLSASVATPIVGRLGDMFGKERMLMVALGALAVGSVLAAVATSIGVLISARVIQGIGAGIFPLAFGIIRDEFPRDRVAGSIGLMSALMGIGGGLGVALSGVIVDNLGYHWLFWIPGVVVILAAILTHFMIPESPVKTPGRINFTGAFLMSGGLAALLLSISQGTDWGWGSPKTVGLGLLAIVLLVAWIRAELIADTPLVDMRMMQIKGVWTTNVVALLLGVGMYSSFILIPQLVLLPPSTGIGFGATATEAGLFLLPSTIAMLLVGPFAGKLEARFGSKPPLIVGVLFTMAAFLMLLFVHGAKLDIYFASLLMGVGIGLSFAAMANLIVQNVKQTQTGVATGMNTVMRSLGGAIGATIAATILTAKLGTDGLPTESGFEWAFAFCVIALAAGALFGLLIPGRTPAEELDGLRPLEPVTDGAAASRVAVEA